MKKFWTPEKFCCLNKYYALSHVEHLSHSFSSQRGRLVQSNPYPTDVSAALLAALSMKNLLLQKRRFLIYCAIGSCSTVLSSITFALLLNFTSAHYQIANAAGYAIGTLLSFVLNVRYNFCVRDWHLLRFASFFVIALLGWAASAVILRVLIEKLNFNEYSAYFSALMVIVILQYNLNRFISFRKAD